MFRFYLAGLIIFADIMQMYKPVSPLQDRKLRSCRQKKNIEMNLYTYVTMYSGAQKSLQMLQDVIMFINDINVFESAGFNISNLTNVLLVKFDCASFFTIKDTCFDISYATQGHSNILKFDSTVQKLFRPEIKEMSLIPAVSSCVGH